MNARLAWLTIAVVGGLGYCIGAQAWDAALFAGLGVVAGAPLLVQRVRRADDLERWVSARHDLSSPREFR